MAKKHLLIILLLVVTVAALILFRPKIKSKQSTEYPLYARVENFWKDNKNNYYINYDSLNIIWDDFRLRSFEYFRINPEMYFWYINRIREISTYYLNIDSVYYYYQELLRKHIPEFRDGTIRTGARLDSTQSGHNLANEIYQSTEIILSRNAEINWKSELDLLLTQIEVSYLLSNIELMTRPIEILNSKYSGFSDKQKEDFWAYLYKSHPYKLYQLFLGALNENTRSLPLYSEWCSVWDPQIRTFIDFIINAKNSSLLDIFNTINVDPMFLGIYQFIIPEICMHKMSTDVIDLLPIREREKYYAFASWCITSANGYYRLDFISLISVYNFDREPYLSILLGELNKIYPGFPAVKSFSELVSSHMISLNKQVIDK